MSEGSAAYQPFSPREPDAAQAAVIRRVAALFAALPEDSWQPDSPDGPLGQLARLDALAERVETPAPAGKVTWRRWGSGRPLLLLHGGGGSWRHWVRNIPVLMQHRTLWVPDVPGYGDSDLPTEPHTFDSISDALLAGLARILPGDAHFDLAGFSFGSHLAARFANRVERRLDRLVLVGANFVSDMKTTKFTGMINWRKREGEARMAAMFSNMQIMMVADPARIDDMALTIYAGDLRFQRLSPIMMPGRVPLYADLAMVDSRMRISGISGADDQVFRHIMARQASALNTLRPGSRFVHIPGASHWVMYEEAGAFNAALLELLDE